MNICLMFDQDFALFILTCSSLREERGVANLVSRIEVSSKLDQHLIDLDRQSGLVKD